jgi:proteasome accessory factor C
VPARDESTERDVDPIRLLLTDGRWYLVGWCRLAEGVRTFRLDRVFGVSVLDTPAEVPPEAADAGIGGTLFEPSSQDTLVTLELEPRARWVADYYRCEQVSELPGGRMRVRLRARDERWLRRLALGLAGSGRVTDPPHFAEAVQADAAAALAAYEPGVTRTA